MRRLLGFIMLLTAFSVITIPLVIEMVVIDVIKAYSLAALIVILIVKGLDFIHG